jgi:hypothetical protein
VQDLPLILLAEDREDDILLLQRSFLKAGIRNPLQVVRDGEDAIAYMEFRKPARTGPKPQKRDVLIREKRSGCFFAGHARWVTTRADALDFERIELAETVATAEHLEGVEIVVAYEAPACELTVPVAFAGIRRP